MNLYEFKGVPTITTRRGWSFTIYDKEGQRLYDAVCYPCHKDSVLKVRNDGSAFMHVVISGIPGTLMPGFAEYSGGLLTEEQIDSLAGLVGLRRRPL